MTEVDGSGNSIPTGIHSPDNLDMHPLGFTGLSEYLWAHLTEHIYLRSHLSGHASPCVIVLCQL